MLSEESVMQKFTVSLIVTLTIFSMFSIFNGCGSSSSKTVVNVPEEIDQRVLNELVPEEEIATPTVIYRYPDLLQPGDTVASVLPQEEDTQGDEEPIETVFTAVNETYFYYIDYYEEHYYAHPVEYIFIDAVNQEVTRVSAEWWPILNGEDLFFTRSQVGNSSHVLKRVIPDGIEVLTELDWNDHAQVIEESTSSTSILPSAPAYHSPLRNAMATALVINGIRSDDDVRSDSEEAAKQAKDGFEAHGYGNVDVIDRKNYSGEDADQNALDAVLKWLDDFEAPEGSNLTIYIVSHGKRTGFYMGKKDNDSDHAYLGTKNFGDALKKLKNEKKIRVKLIAQPCFSGAFVNKSSIKNHLVLGVTAAWGTKARASDIDEITDKKGKLIATDKNPDDKGPEFTSGYFEDYNENSTKYETDEEFKVWLDNFSAETGVPVEELILAASFHSALEKDLTVHIKYGKYSPGDDSKTTTPRIFIPGAHQKLKSDNKKKSNIKNVPDWVEVVNGKMTINEYDEIYSSSSSESSSSNSSSSSSSGVAKCGSAPRCGSGAPLRGVKRYFSR